MHLQNTCVKKCLSHFQQWNLQALQGKHRSLSGLQREMCQQNVSLLKLKSSQDPTAITCHLHNREYTNNVVYSALNRVWAYFYPGKEPEIPAFCIAWCAPKHSRLCLACVDVREFSIFLQHFVLLYLKQSRNMLDINKIYHPPKMKQVLVLLLMIKYESRTALGQMTV